MRLRFRSGRRALITACVLAVAASAARAEIDGRTGGEFRAGVGALPVQTLFELFTDITMATLSIGTLEPSTETERAAAFVEYAKPMGERSRLVAHFNIASYEKEYLIESSGQLAGRVSDDFYTFMLGVKHYYVRTGSFALYLDTMAGVSMLHTTTDIDELETGDTFLLAYQFTPLGMRLGGAAALDLALGLGYKGIVSIGLGYEF
ncbi:hypothetical protein KKG45_09175 [bacterium]|nr:hypothetical protein [bacterium]MBU1073405.1 hypothetical protein [bacterium]MBU1676462.1 hypothetical protein [bacterium]